MFFFHDFGGEKPSKTGWSIRSNLQAHPQMTNDLLRVGLYIAEAVNSKRRLLFSCSMLYFIYGIIMRIFP